MKNESSSVFEHTYEEVDDYTFSVTANNGVSQVSVDRPIKIVPGTLARPTLHSRAII